MGKKSRNKRERRAENISGKMLKKMRRESETGLITCQDGHTQLYNPVKKLAQARLYKDETGRVMMNQAVQQYAAFMRQQMDKYKENKAKAQEEGR